MALPGEGRLALGLPSARDAGGSICQVGDSKLGAHPSLTALAR